MLFGGKWVYTEGKRRSKSLVSIANPVNPCKLMYLVKWFSSFHWHRSSSRMFSSPTTRVIRVWVWSWGSTLFSWHHLRNSQRVREFGEAQTQCVGLEFWINFWNLSAGGKGRLDSSIKHLMSVAYDLLNRDLYGRILIAHLDRRSAADAKDKFVME